MSRMKNLTIKCDYCGKFTRNEDGYYKKKDGTAGYIHSPDWDKDGAFDTCEECAANRCPKCASLIIVHTTPATAGPNGWGGRCKSCGFTWGFQEHDILFDANARH